MAPSSAMSRGTVEPSPSTVSAPSSCMGSFRVLTSVRVRAAMRTSLLSSPSRVRWITVMSSIWIASARMAMPETPPPSLSCLWRSSSFVRRMISPRFSHSRSLMTGRGCGAGGRACGSVMSAVTPAMTIVPTSTLPLSNGSGDSPTSSSAIEASMSGSYSVSAGRFSEVLSSLSANRGKKLSSVSPSTTSSPPVWARICSRTISSSACSSIKMGTSSTIRPTVATSAPTIHRITITSLTPDSSETSAY